MHLQLLKTVLLAGMAATFLACAGTPKAPLKPLPKPATVGTLVGATCREGRCLCRHAKQKIGLPENTNIKRFEVRIGPIRNVLWVKIGHTQLYKTGQTATQCFYVDLPPGKHKVIVQGYSANDLSARVAISEMAPKEVGWYDTFYFNCGGVDVCDVAQLKEFRRRLDTYRGGVHDRCGSTKVTAVSWRTGKLPDNLHPNHIQLELTLRVYPFSPKHPPKHKACR